MRISEIHVDLRRRMEGLLSGHGPAEAAIEIAVLDLPAKRCNPLDGIAVEAGQFRRPQVPGPGIIPDESVFGAPLESFSRGDAACRRASPGLVASPGLALP